ncbi:LacI family transcriptional regulator [Fulvitalea axinellae]|uniref:LacI family transcriptional regulator n=1 Tax=Fulvitalea axinellae TaxID=1182444 RepID=A0AAU9C852_9BACT|nr:LacI family transcriptional regulator [Fulvitalea axinellae]
MKRYSSINDLAKDLKLSASTVSRALSDHYSISDKTKKRVREYAKKVGYQPNLNASNLIHRRTNIIGLIVPGITSYFFATILKGILSVLDKENYRLIIMETGDSLEKEIESVRFLTSVRAEGILFSPTSKTDTYEHFEPLVRNRIPFVNFDRGLKDLPCSSVLCDGELGAMKATQHLIDVGCKRIAHITGPENLMNASNRLKGYKKALRKNGLKIDEKLIIKGAFNLERGMGAVRQLFSFDPLPDGILAANDGIALACLSEIRKRNLKAPEDIAVAGFDNEAYSAHFTPPLTSVDNRIFDMGKTAADLCVKQIQSDKPVEPETVILEPELVVRESSRKGRVLHYV